MGRGGRGRMGDHAGSDEVDGVVAVFADNASNQRLVARPTSLQVLNTGIIALPAPILDICTRSALARRLRSAVPSGLLIGSEDTKPASGINEG